MDKSKEFYLDGELTHESLRELQAEAQRLLDELEKKEQTPKPDKKAV